MGEHEITPTELAGLVERMDEAAGAYIRGDSHHYLSLFDYSDDWTLMPPYGGETRREAYNEQKADEDSRFFTARGLDT